MKVFFDSNVYIAEALLGRAASRMLHATSRARWRIYSSDHIIKEVARVMVEDLDFSKRFASLTQQRIAQRTTLVRIKRSVKVLQDPNDSPILQAALTCAADYLVTNDRHLLSLNPFEKLQIISMDDYHRMLEAHGHIRTRS
jgi:putative PIN family toxin of toxin-antitoxin system